VIVSLTMNPTIDTSSRVGHVVAERKLRCKPPCHEPGGGGINVSRVIRRLGGDSLALYLSGGWYGHMLQGLLDQEGLNHSPISIEGSTRQNVIVLEESSGRQFRFGMPGPTLHEAEWKRCLEVLETLAPKPDYLVGSGSLSPGVPDDFYARVARIATKRGIRLIVDTSGEALRLAARAGGVYLLKPNMRELRALADHEIKDELEQERVVTEIIRKGGSELVVVSLGTAGALMASKEGCERLRAPTVPIQSKVGAGDSMVAGIVLSLAQGKSPRDAVHFGVAAGAAAAMTPGTELCRREDTERLYRHMVSENA